MTYKLQEIISKITSPVVLLIEGEEHFSFENGVQAYDTEYDRYYIVSNIQSKEGKIYVTLVENKRINDMNWCGEIQTSFF